jgi:MraZ protein
VSDVELLTLDGNGRFLIPRRYMKMACINQAVKFIGMDDTIEIWSNDEPDVPFMNPDEFSSALEEIMQTKTEND